MQRIVILTGAGISAESGLGTFRDNGEGGGGIWSRFDLSRVATPEGFARDPARVHAFYNLRRASCAAAQPNAAHRALARLQRAAPDRVTLVSQNVDDLHIRAGSPEVIAMHGALMDARCAACGHVWPAPMAMAAEDPCPACSRPATRPDVVWFGEIPRHLDRIGAALARAGLFVAIGTSGTVWPAAGFVQEAREAGAATLEINLVPSGASSLFDACRTGSATQTVPAWVDGLLG